MLGQRIRLFSLFGFDVRVDASWLLLAALVAWSLAEGVFPELTPGLGAATYWWMATAVTIGLLISIVLHETAHSLVARRFGIAIRGITLFVFGGVAELEGELKRARSELLMAIAGPIASLCIAFALFLILEVGKRFAIPDAVAGALWYLSYINLVLALFNLVPAFPLDGGRILRAALWAWRGDILWGTQIAATAGELFGLLLMALGIVEFLRGDFVGGLWQFLIGAFLRGAASIEYQQTVAQQVFAHVQVAQLMNEQPISVSPNMTVAECVEGFIYRYHHDEFPVVRNGRLIGTIGTQQAAKLARSRWRTTSVDDAMVPCGDAATIDAGSLVLEALAKLSGSGKKHLYVSRNGQLAGVIALRDLRDILSIRLELLDDPGAANTLMRAGR